jgi:AraC family transcriptional regulator, chitin signaling transcriptional activator
MNNWRLGYILLLVFLFQVDRALGQDYLPYNYRVEQGLPTNLTKTIFQDSLGFTWIGTDVGLVRFDGKSFLHLKMALPSTYVKSILCLRNGKILVVHDLGVSTIENHIDTVVVKKYIVGEAYETDTTLFYPKSIYEDSNNTLWIGESQAVVKVRNGKIVKRYSFGTKDGTASFLRSFCFVEDGQGNFLVSSQQGYLYRYDTEKDEFVSLYDKPFMVISFMDAVDKGKVWFGTHLGIFEVILNQAGKIISSKYVAYIQDVSCLKPVQDGKYVVGSWNKGVYFLHKTENGYELRRMQNVTPLVINSIFIDAIDRIWISSDDGIAFLEAHFFTKVNLHTSRSYIQTLVKAENGQIYGVEGADMFVIDQDSNQFDAKVYIEIEHSSEDFLSMAATQSSFWIGSSKGRLYKVTNKKVAMVLNPIKSGGIFYLKSDSKGNVWGCLGNNIGVIKVDMNDKVTIYQGEKGLNTPVYAIAEDAYGNVYCATGGKHDYLLRYDKEKDCFVNESIPIPIDVGEDFVINDFQFGDEGNIYLGSNYGLFVIEGNSIRKQLLVNHADGTEIEGVKAIALTPDGKIWAGTDFGLVYYSDDHCILFDEQSGLPSKTIPYRGIMVDYPRGIWIATTSGIGFSKFKKIITQTPKPVFLSLNINGQKVPLKVDDKLEFKNDSFLQANYVSLTYPGDKVYYQTRLVGLQDKWSNSTLQSEVIIPKIPNGDYILEARALKPGGHLWSEPVRFPFKISKAWYQTWWAIGLFFSFLFGLIWIAVKINSWRLEKEKQALEAIIRSRTAEVVKQNKEIAKQAESLNAALEHLKSTQAQLLQSEKMASLGVLTAGVAHEINNPITFVSAGIESLKDVYSEIEEILGQYLLLNPDQDNSEKIKELKELTRKLNVDELLEDAKSLLKSIQIGASRTTEIVKSLRNFTRLDENSIKRIDLHDGIDATLVILHNQIKDKIDIVKDYGQIPWVECYPGQINQVFMNILSNGIQAITGKGKIHIVTRFINTTEAAHSKEMVEVRIIDDGKGMSPEVKSRIFEPFFTTKDVGKGTGMGLSITYGIIEKHKGAISVESVLGKGTEFIIQLPVKFDGEVTEKQSSFDAGLEV